MATKNWTQLVVGARPALTDLLPPWQGSDIVQVPASQFAGLGHYVLLDSFPGANDDAKLTAALAYAQAATYTPPIRLSPRLYVFATNNRAPFDGMVIAGPGDNALSTASGSQARRTHEVQLNFDSSSSGIGWFHQPSAATPVQLQSMSFLDLALVDGGGSGHASFLTQAAPPSGSGAGAGGFLQLLVRNLTTNGLWSVIGTPAQKLLMTACIFDGNWDLNNGWNTAVHVGGSDCSLWDGGGQMLMDSPGAGDSVPHEPAGDGVPHIHLNFLDKSVVGRIYCTADGKWYAIQVDGQPYNSGSTGGNGGPLVIRGLVAEGRKRDNPCYGHVVRVDGGLPIFESPWFGYGMSNAALQGTPGSGTQAAGMIHCTNGMTRIYAPTYGNANGVLTTVPLIYASGATTLVRARDAAVGSQAGVWPGAALPATQAANGASIDKDNSLA